MTRVRFSCERWPSPLYVRLLRKDEASLVDTELTAPVLSLVRSFSLAIPLLAMLSGCGPKDGTEDWCESVRAKTINLSNSAQIISFEKECLDIDPKSGNEYKFTYKTLWIAILKLNSASYNFEGNADGLMDLFRPIVSQHVRDNEFEEPAARKRTVEMVKDLVESYKIEEPIVVQTTIEFGQYDFAKRRFELHPFDGHTDFPARLDTMSSERVRQLPSLIFLYVANPDFIDGLPMDPDKARVFLDRHEVGGHIDRRLSAELSFRPIAPKYDDALIGRLDKVVVTDMTDKTVVMKLDLKADGPAAINPQSP